MYYSKSENSRDAITFFMETRKWLWECREREIDHMWKRGAFLATFIVGAFTAYFKIVCETHEFSMPMVHGYASLICLVGLVLSLLWIAMSKGAIAWYSIYEQASEDLIRSCWNASKDDAEILNGIFGAKCPLVNNGLAKTGINWSDSYCKGLGGCYSLPRINIAIGHLLFVMWMVLYVWHGVRFVQSVCPIVWSVVCLKCFVIVAFCLINVFVVFGYILYSNVFLKSKSLSGYLKNLREIEVQNSKRSDRICEVLLRAISKFESRHHYTCKEGPAYHE